MFELWDFFYNYGFQGLQSIHKPKKSAQKTEKCGEVFLKASNGTKKTLEGFFWTCFAPGGAKTGFLKRKNSKASIETGKFREFATVVTTSFGPSTQLF